MSRVPLSLLVFVVCLLACSSGDAEKPALPPPLPTPAPAAAEPMVEGAEPPPAPIPSQPVRPVKTGKTRPAKPSKVTTPVPVRSAPVSQPVVVPTPTPRPAPVAAPAPAPAPVSMPAPAAKRVVVPRTDHVHVELPGGLQSDLDADPRMQKWVDRVIAIVDGCHARNRAATGAVEALVTMHENDRPSASVRSLPGQLSGIVPCATGSLLGVKMPLFTGREGTRYTVRIIFE